MGMPALAMAAGGLYAADKLIVDPVSSIYGLYKTIRNDQDEQADLKQFQLDSQNPTSFNPANYRNPIAAAQVAESVKPMLERQAAPAMQKLNEFAATGQPSNNISFANINQLNTDNGIPSDFNPALLSQKELSNPIVSKSLSDFKAQEGRTNMLAQSIDNPTAQNVARLLPVFGPQHMGSALNAIRQAVPQVDTTTPALRDFTTKTYDLFAQSGDLNEFIQGGGKLLSETKADPKEAAKLLEQLSKNFQVDKPEGAPHLVEKHLKGGLVQKYQYDPTAQGPDKFTLPIGNPYKPTAQQSLEIRQTSNATDPAHNDALDRAVAEKRLDPYKINSRNRQDLARMAHNNPGIDLNGIASEMGVARNKDVIMKAGVAEMIPGLLKETVDAGRKLKYSDVQLVGKIQQFRNGQLNDPQMTEYMTLRNDQLLTIGGVMRANGMTDMAQRLEEEAAKPTMSPRALEGWLSGQLKSIDPRLSMYRSLTKGNKAIPRSEYNPGDGAKKLMGEGRSNLPEIGTVKGGYRFNGGNPANKNSWSRVGG